MISITSLNLFCTSIQLSFFIPIHHYYYFSIGVEASKSNDAAHISHTTDKVMPNVSWTEMARFIKWSA